MQKQLISLFVVLLTLLICSQAQTCGGSNCDNGGDTNINFYFADMLAGANQGSSLPSSPSTGNSSDSYDESEDAFAIEQTIYGLFAVNERASNDQSSNVNSATYSALVSPYVSNNVVLSSINVIINNGAPTTYNGVNGIVQYFNDLSTSRSSGRQALTNLAFDFSGYSNCPETGSVTVNAAFSGIESLRSNSSYQTFYGTRSYSLIPSSSSRFGWAIQTLTAIRYITRPSPNYSAYFAQQAQATVLALIDINDQAGNGNAITAAQVSPLVTSTFTVEANVPVANSSYASGPSAFVNFIQAISGSRVASQTQLSNFQYSFSDDDSTVTVRAKAIGYEFLSTGSNDLFFGTRDFVVVRGDDGVFRADSLTFIRTALFPQAGNATAY